MTLFDQLEFAEEYFDKNFSLAKATTPPAALAQKYLKKATTLCKRKIVVNCQYIGLKIDEQAGSVMSQK